MGGRGRGGAGRERGRPFPRVAQVAMRQDTTMEWTVVNWSINAVFIVDMVLQFFMAYQESTKKGGTWVLSIPKQRRKSVDLWWMYIVLIMIGENFDDSGDVCGVVVSLRKSQDRIALWTKTATNEALQMSIGAKIRAGLELPRALQLKYQSHADAYASGSSFQNKVHYEV